MRKFHDMRMYLIELSKTRSVRAVGEYVGVHFSIVHRIINGTSRNPSINTLERISEAMDRDNYVAEDLYGKN